ncbi:hypothetical protein [Kitasatospora acidiphila]|uniref:hypothetical protein n=1 Tax=Kitasatospora acidiphila TaxID=2567942 RepID=UPI003C78F20A
MDLAAVLADLDQVAWHELEHAYGSAEDVPALLRALTGADQEAVAEADEELWSSLVHQGTVYQATVVAVPFLARLLAAGVHRAKLLDIVGAVAESTDEHDLARPGAARAAVVAQLPLLLPLLSDADAEVRQGAAWAVAQCGQAAGPGARAALRRRWEAEGDPVLRADLLTACVRVDPAAAEELCAAALRAVEPPPVRVAALLAWVDTGRPWAPELAAVVTELAPLKQHVQSSSWERGPLKAIAAALCERGNVDAAIEVVVAALDRAVAGSGTGGDAKSAATEATWAAESLAWRFRSAPARLLPAMLPLLDDPATADSVIFAVRYWAEPAPQAVPALVRLAEGTSEVADRALAALVSLGEAGAADLLARQLTERPQALAAAFERTTRRPPAPLPCTPALLDAVRVRLAAWASEAATPRERRSVFDGGLAAVNEPIHLAGLLAGWGRAARVAIPELLDAMPHHPGAVRALGAVADAELDREAVNALRSAAEAGSLANRQASATALRALTGEVGPLLAGLESAFAEHGRSREHAVEAAAALGEQARPLLPQLLALLAEPAEGRTTTPVVSAGLVAAAAVWQLTGDQEPVLPMVLEGLGWATQPWGGQVANRAAELAARLGPAALPAVPQLLSMLEERDTAAAATRALVAVHPGSDRPGGVTLGELVDRVLPAAEPSAYLSPALAALEALAVLGPAAFAAAQVERIRLLAEGERRVVGAGGHTEIIGGDLRFRAAARRLVADLTS